MTYEIITHEDLQKFRLQLLEDLTRMMPACRSCSVGRSGAVQPQSNKEWLRSSEVRKMLGISHGTLQNLRIKNILPHRKIGGLMYYKYQDIVRLLEGDDVKTNSYGKAI
jgi:hypothetical protein